VTLLELVFWGSVGLVAYTYVGYPALMWVLTRFKRPLPSPPSPPVWPSVTMIVAAYNEDGVIAEKIENCLALDYPKDRFTLLVGSDGSSDRTVAVASAFQADARVKVHALPRRGKVFVINDLVREADGEILLFSDANTLYDAGAVKILAAHFGDAAVGCASGLLRLRKRGEHVGASGESFYWKYETLKKRQENRFRAVAGANGAIYAIRRELFRPLSPRTINDDFTTSMGVYLQGRRIVLAEDARAYEDTASDFLGEFHRHVRDSAGHFRAMIELRGLLNPFLGMPSFCYISHRVIRWTTPFFMLFALSSSAWLARESGVYLALFLLQAAGYAGAAIASPHVFRGGRLGPLFVPYYFIMVNLSILVGFAKFCAGTQTSLWQPTERQQGSS
jgi:biofilm PGA synthesis N-glycosyltransferase PgaC